MGFPGSELHHRVRRRMILVDNFFVFLRLLFFCFVVAICDLVHDLKTILYLSYLLTASGNLFLNMSDAHETAN